MLLWRFPCNVEPEAIVCFSCSCSQVLQHDYNGEEEKKKKYQKQGLLMTGTEKTNQLLKIEEC